MKDQYTRASRGELLVHLLAVKLKGSPDVEFVLGVDSNTIDNTGMWWELKLTRYANKMHDQIERSGLINFPVDMESLAFAAASGIKGQYDLSSKHEDQDGYLVRTVWLRGESSCKMIEVMCENRIKASPSAWTTMMRRLCNDHGRTKLFTLDALIDREDVEGSMMPS